MTTEPLTNDELATMLTRAQEAHYGRAEPSRIERLIEEVQEQRMRQDGLWAHIRYLEDFIREKLGMCGPPIHPRPAENDHGRSDA